MKKKFIYLLLLTFILCLSPITFSDPIKSNLYFIKEKLTRYHDSGAYYYAIDKVDQRAENYLAKRVSENNQATTKKKLAIVLDIDETSLSNFKAIKDNDFAVIPKKFQAAQADAKDPAIPSTLRLYQYAISQGVTVFFITGRSESLRQNTEKNLQQAGYKTWQTLYMKPLDYQPSSVIPYKSESRKKIIDQGYDIVMNIGDQYSDIAGGYADRAYKLPNPYYYVK